MKQFIASMLLLVGCAAKKPLVVSHKVTIEFRNVRDGKCEVKDVELDAKNGREVVVCK